MLRRLKTCATGLFARELRKSYHRFASRRTKSAVPTSMNAANISAIVRRFVNGPSSTTW
jgi:hypothetical protein